MISTLVEGYKKDLLQGYIYTVRSRGSDARRNLVRLRLVLQERFPFVVNKDLGLASLLESALLGIVSELPEHDKVEEDGPRRSEQPRGVDHDVLCARAGEEDRLQRVGVSSRTHRRLRLKKTHGNVGGVTADGERKHEQRQAGALCLPVQVQLRQPGANWYGQDVWGQLWVKARSNR